MTRDYCEACGYTDSHDPNCPMPKAAVKVKAREDGRFDLFVHDTYCGNYEQAVVTPLANALTEALRPAPLKVTIRDPRPGEGPLEPKPFPTWYCGCGHTNGCNLPTCAACGRDPTGEPRGKPTP